MSAYLLFAGLPILGVIAGLAKVVSPRVPFIAAGLVVVAYVLYLAAVGIWAGACWDCYYHETRRADVFTIGAYVLGFLALTTLVGIWLGARLITVLQRLRETWREIRDDGDHPAAERG